MGTSFTPGPWHIGNGDIYADGNSLSGYDDRVICALGKAGSFRSQDYSVIEGHRTEGKANARLIAAAPDLLDAALLLVSYDDSDEVDASNVTMMVRYAKAIQAARAAIARATGKEA